MTYDLIILGGGPAGYLAAERAGHAGMKVLCIEQRELGGVKAALRANHVETLNARGVITGRNSEGYTVEAGGSTYTGARLLICTGSSPAIPPIPGLKEGLESGFAVTNRELLSLTEAPRRLVVIGGGVIGLEMAAYFNSIGSEITVIEMLDHIAGENDRELVGILQKHYEKQWSATRFSYPSEEGLI